MNAIMTQTNLAELSAEAQRERAEKEAKRVRLLHLATFHQAIGMALETTGCTVKYYDYADYGDGETKVKHLASAYIGTVGVDLTAAVETAPRSNDVVAIKVSANYKLLGRYKVTGGSKFNLAGIVERVRGAIEHKSNVLLAEAHAAETKAAGRRQFEQAAASLGAKVQSYSTSINLDQVRIEQARDALSVTAWGLTAEQAVELVAFVKALKAPPACSGRDSFHPCGKPTTGKTWADGSPCCDGCAARDAAGV